MCDPTEADGTHTTTPEGTGDDGRLTVVPEPNTTTPPENSAGLANVTLDNDPEYGSEFPGASDYRVLDEFADRAQSQRKVEVTIPRWRHTYIVLVTDTMLSRSTQPWIKLHRRVAKQFLAFFWAAAARDVADSVLYVGSYASRTITGSITEISNHAMGTAVDINYQHGYNNRDSPTLPFGTPRGQTGSVWDLVDFCTDFGLFWGGWYDGEETPYDPMHFEAVKIIEGDDLRAVCEAHGLDFDNLCETADRFVAIR